MITYMMNQKRGLTGDGDLLVPNIIAENLQLHFNLTILVHYICFDINLEPRNLTTKQIATNNACYTTNTSKNNQLFACICKSTEKLRSIPSKQKSNASDIGFVKFTPLL